MTQTLIFLKLNLHVIVINELLLLWVVKHKNDRDSVETRLLSLSDF